MRSWLGGGRRRWGRCFSRKRRQRHGRVGKAGKALVLVLVRRERMWPMERLGLFRLVLQGRALGLLLGNPHPLLTPVLQAPLDPLHPATSPPRQLLSRSLVPANLPLLNAPPHQAPSFAHPPQHQYHLRPIRRLHQIAPILLVTSSHKLRIRRVSLRKLKRRFGTSSCHGRCWLVGCCSSLLLRRYLR